MAEPTWEEREIPILEAVADAEYREDHHSLLLGDVVKDLGLEKRDRQIASRALYESDFLTGAADQMLGPGGFTVTSPRLTEKGRRAIGQWPSEDSFERLVELLTQRIASETNEERKNKMQALLGALTDMGKGVAGALLSAYIRHSVGF